MTYGNNAGFGNSGAGDPMGYGQYGSGQYGAGPQLPVPFQPQASYPVQQPYPQAEQYPGQGYQPDPYQQNPYGQPQNPYQANPYGQNLYGQNLYGQPVGGAPYGVDPATGLPFSDKTKTAAGLLQLFLGGFGAGRWYIGSYGIASAQLILMIVGWLLSFVLVGIPIVFGVGIWALIDAIMMFTGSVRDGDGRVLRP